MVVATSLLGFITRAFSAFSRIDRPHVAWTSVAVAIFALLTCAYVSPTPASATAGINRQINFQGRLLNSQGATVPDGFYNMQFKIYQDGAGTAVGNPGGTLMWTESHLNANSQGVTVKNGFLSVQLGSINAFGSQVDWNQDTIWLSMNIGNTNVSCTPFSSCAPDGEMVPMKRMTATPYALNSGLLNGLASSNFVQLAQGVQTDASTASSIFINKTASGNLLQLQNTGADAFTVSNAGDLVFGAAANHNISIATAAAATAGKTLTMAAGAGGSGAGSAGGDLVLQGGAAGGTDGNGGNVTINAGAKTGTGTNGTLSLGTANTSGIVLGASTVVSANQSLTLTGGATGTRPASPTEGMIYFDTTTKQLLTYSNGKWQADRSTATKIVAASNSPQEVKDAADYVADGTGDQTEINAALSAVSTIAGQTAANGSVTASGGGKVYLAEGTFVANATILIPNNTTLAGAGRSTLIELADLDATENLIENSDTTTGTGVRIQDLRIDGRNDLNSGAIAQHGIVFGGMGAGAGSSARQGGLISGVTANNFHDYGIFLTASSNNILIGNRAQGNTVGGFGFGTGAHYNTITGNSAQGSTYGFVVGTAGNTITGNNVQGHTNTGIYLAGGLNNTITGNSVNGNSVYGIALTANSHRNTITGNKLYDNGGTTTNNAILLSGSDSNTIATNNIDDTSATTNNYAINVFESTSETNHLSGNTFGGGGLNDAGTGTVLSNNMLGGGAITGTDATRVYSGQIDSSNNYLIQPAGTIELMKNTNVTGNLAVTGDGSFTGGDLTIATTTATDDRFVLNVTSGGAARFDGTLKVADLTANRTWTLPDETGVICTTGSVCSGYAAVSASGSYVQFAPASAQADGTNNNSIYINKTSGTGNIIALQKSGVDVFTINNVGDANFSQNVTIAAGKSLALVGGDTASRPASPAEGMVYFDTDTDKLLVYSNGKWQADRTSVTKTVAPSNASQHIKDSADYVADGTGDQAEINSALTAAAGGKVYLFEGTFTTADTISIPNDTTLIGSGKGTLIQFGNLGGVSKNMITNTTTGGSGTGITIRDLKLDGNKTTNSTDTFTGIYLDGAGSSSTNLPGATITNVAIQNFENNGIHLTNSANNNITGNTVQLNDDHGIFTNTATTGNHDIITGNTITNNTLNGVYLNATVRSNVSDNFIASNGNYGIRIESGSNNTINSNVLRSNTGSGATSSIHIIGGGGSEAHIITDNNITDTAGTGYAINLVDAAVDGVYLSNNVFSGTGASTINDASGGDTIYSGQNNGNSYLIQPVDDFSFTGSAASTISTTAGDLTVQGGSGTVTLGTSTNLTAGGALTIASAASTALTLTSNAASTWKTTSGSLTIDSAATLNLGTTDATGLSLSKTGATTTINGHLTIATGQNLTVNGDVITDLTGSGLTLAGSALTVDASSATGFFRNGGNSFGTGATLGTNDNNALALRTNSTTRATFSNTSNTLYMGNGDASGLAASPNAFTIQGTSHSGTGGGGALTIQAGNSGSSANGANLTLSGGTSANNVSGLVILTTPTFQNAGTDANCYTGGALVANDCTIHANSVNNNSSILVGFSASGKTATLPDPAIATPGRVVYVIGANTSSDFTLSVNGGGSVSNLIALRANATATMVWNGLDWTAAGASSSTTLQAAYDNTLQSSGGAELIVGKTSNTNGLTIRDSTVNPVAGPLVSIQSNSAANLFSVNSNVTDYASNPGAESGTGASFPASTWSALNGNTTATRHTTAGNYIATGQGSVSAASNGTALTGIKNTLTSALSANNHYNVSFSARLTAGNPAFTDMDVYYSIDGSAASVQCKNAVAISESVWTKVNCSFTAPSSGINSSNAIFIRQTGASSARTFYIDNLSVTIAADYSLTTDGGVDDGTNFTTNYTTTGTGSTVTTPRITNDGKSASSSAEVVITTGGTDRGIKNKVSINPLTDALYRVSVYARQTSGAAFTDFKIRYTRDGGTNFVNCVDYSTQTVTSSWAKVTCYIKTDATGASNPQLAFVAASSANRTFRIDDLSMTLASPTTPNVQVGSGTNGGPTTLFTLDRGASAPIAGDNESLLGSMYYDTTLGKLQCYEADGWGACGSSPDNIVTLSPEYTNAVMHGTGVGTMTSDICSGALNINDPTNGPEICSETETKNFYRWTSPQASLQAYSIYVTYQLPSTFKSFASGSTSVAGRVDNTSNASINYQVYRSNAISGLTACPASVNVASGAANSWDPGIATGTADPSTCGFTANDSIVFKITMSSKSNANVYIGNIGFTFSNN